MPLRRNVRRYAIWGLRGRRPRGMFAPSAARCVNSGGGVSGPSCRDASSLSVSRDGDAGGLLLEVLAQHRHLALVVGAEVVAVEALRRRRHPLQAQLADRLAVLDHEGDVAGADLERGTAAVAPALGVVAEAGIEEA